ncbi:hypothetical protein OAU50_08070 [Planctomycetota bacterium]|nr:hypothetical protein [Planctomycetota bacterium]
MTQSDYETPVPNKRVYNLTVFKSGMLALFLLLFLPTTPILILVTIQSPTTNHIIGSVIGITFSSMILILICRRLINQRLEILPDGSAIYGRFRKRRVSLEDISGYKYDWKTSWGIKVEWLSFYDEDDNLMFEIFNDLKHWQDICSWTHAQFVSLDGQYPHSVLQRNTGGRRIFRILLTVGASLLGIWSIVTWETRDWAIETRGDDYKVALNAEHDPLFAGIGTTPKATLAAKEFVASYEELQNASFLTSLYYCFAMDDPYETYKGAIRLHYAKEEAGTGLIISSVAPGTQSARYLQPGDKISALNGRPISSQEGWDSLTKSFAALDKRGEALDGVVILFVRDNYADRVKISIADLAGIVVAP